MATILAFATHTQDIEDKRDRTENIVRDSIKLKTSERVSWTQLRTMRPVPQWDDQHSTETGFYLDFIKPKHTSRLVWELEAEYTPTKGGQIDANPTARPAVITFQTSLVEQPTLFDKNRKPTASTAGQFILGINEQIPLIEYTVEKNLPSDPRWLQTHLGAVNKDAIRIRGLNWEPKTLLLSAVSGGAYSTENRVEFSPFRLTLLGDARTWTQEVWNQGTVELVETFQVVNGKPRSVWTQRPILRGSPAKPVEDPWPLDADGVALVDHLDPKAGAGITPGRLLTLKFETQKDMQFRGVLPLV